MTRGVIIFIIIIMVLGTAFAVSSMNESEDTGGEKQETIEDSKLEGETWPVTAMTRNIPKPKEGTLKVKTMAKTSFSFELSDIREYVYDEYVIEAKEMGFTNSMNENHGFMGINEDGYAIIIRYNSGIMDVTITN